MLQQHFPETRLKYKGQTFEHDFLEYLAGNPWFLIAPADLSTPFYFPFFFPKSDFTFPQAIHFILVLFILLFYNPLACFQSIINSLSTPLSVQDSAEEILSKFLKNGRICNSEGMNTVSKGKDHLRNTFVKTRIWPSWYYNIGTAASSCLLIQKWAHELIYLIILVQSKDTCNNLHNSYLLSFCRQFRTMCNAFNQSFISILKMKSSKNRLWSNINSCTISSV